MQNVHAFQLTDNRCSKELELEILTKRYILGEINISEYRSCSNTLDIHLDLRKLASKVGIKDINDIPKDNPRDSNTDCK